MASNSSRGACPSPARPAARYEELRFADGTHTGVRVDRGRMVLEVQKRGRREYFDIALIVDSGERVCYTDEQLKPPHCTQ